MIRTAIARTNISPLRLMLRSPVLAYDCSSLWWLLVSTIRFRYLILGCSLSGFVCSTAVAEDSNRGLVDMLVSETAQGSHVKNLFAADLDGKRLFFDATERNKHNGYQIRDEQAQVVSNAAQGSSEVNSVNPTRQEHTAGDKMDTVGNAKSTTLLRYNARISSNHAIAVIVNDVPCVAVDRLELAASSQGLQLECKFAGAVLPVMVLQKDERTLLVRGVASQESSMLPGQTQ